MVTRSKTEDDAGSIVKIGCWVVGCGTSSEVDKGASTVVLHRTKTSTAESNIIGPLGSVVVRLSYLAATEFLIMWYPSGEVGPSLQSIISRQMTSKYNRSSVTWVQEGLCMG